MSLRQSSPAGSVAVINDYLQMRNCNVPGCHTFALSKPLSGAPGRLRLVAAVGRRLLLFVWRNVIARPAALAEWNEFRQSQVDSSFQFARVRASSRCLLPFVKHSTHKVIHYTRTKHTTLFYK